MTNPIPMWALVACIVGLAAQGSTRTHPVISKAYDAKASTTGANEHSEEHVGTTDTSHSEDEATSSTTNANGDHTVASADKDADPLARYPTVKSQTRLLEIYQDAFREKRAAQVAVAESLVAKDDYALQYSLSKVLADESFRTLRQAQKNLSSIDVSQLPAIPVANRTVLISLINVWETTALLGDLVLRLPDIMHLQIDSHPLRPSVLEWGVRMCLESPVWDDTQRRQLDLILQEMNMVERPPGYANPFSEAARRKRAEDRAAAELAQKEAIERVMRKKARGPMLSRPRM